MFYHFLLKIITNRDIKKGKKKTGWIYSFVELIFDYTIRILFLVQSHLIALYTYCLHRYRLIGRQLYFFDYYL